MASSSQNPAPPSHLTEKQMVTGMRNHYNQKEERLSQVKVQVDIVHSTIQKRFQQLSTRDKENAATPVLVSREEWDQLSYLHKQLAQLSDNLRNLGSDENEELRHLEYIRTYCKKCSKRDNSNFMAKVQELERMHTANCLQKEVIENCVNRAIRHLFKIKKSLNCDDYDKEFKGEESQNVKGIGQRADTKKPALQERNQ